MKSTIFSILVVIVGMCLCTSTTHAFVVRPSVVSPAATTTSLNVFGNKKSQAQKTEEDPKYWQGEWVCKDCGYIYNRVSLIAGITFMHAKM
jgi:hypothetical protein